MHGFQVLSQLHNFPVHLSVIAAWQYICFAIQEWSVLEELYLSHNGIQNMEGFSTLQNLRDLDVSSIKLTTIENVETLTR